MFFFWSLGQRQQDSLRSASETRAADLQSRPEEVIVDDSVRPLWSTTRRGYSLRLPGVRSGATTTSAARRYAEEAFRNCCTDTHEGVEEKDRGQGPQTSGHRRDNSGGSWSLGGVVRSSTLNKVAMGEEVGASSSPCSPLSRPNCAQMVGTVAAGRRSRSHAVVTNQNSAGTVPPAWGLSDKLIDFNFGGTAVVAQPNDTTSSTAAGKKKDRLRKTHSMELERRGRKGGGPRGEGEAGTSTSGSSAIAFAEQLHALHQRQLTGAGEEEDEEEAESGSSDDGSHRGEAGRGATGETTVPSSSSSSPAPSTAAPEKLGRIQFSISYDFQSMTLTLRVIRAVDLPAKDLCGTSDPYVKILLLPDRKRKLLTNIKRKNLNPRWNELFAFEGYPYNKILTRTLYLQVLDYDRFSRDDPIGEICVPLGDLDLASGQTLWKTLEPCKGHTGRLGELNVGLCYQPTAGRISVIIHGARQLKAKDINGLSDPYVKIWLLFEGKKVEKKKTEVKEKTLNPIFDESFVFDVPYERIRATSISVSVMDHDRVGRNEPIGQIILGTKSGPLEVKHWNEMFARSRQPVTQWHILKDFG